MLTASLKLFCPKYYMWFMVFIFMNFFTLAALSGTELLHWLNDFTAITLELKVKCLSTCHFECAVCLMRN